MSAAPLPDAQPTTAQSAAPAEAPTGWGRWLYVAIPLFVLGAFFVLNDLANRPPVLAGDIWEHWLIAESFHRHGSPELRETHDEDDEKLPVYNEARRLKIGEPPKFPHAYQPTPDGRAYGVHFWAYGMCGVPAKAYLRWSGTNSELAWPGLSNAMWFIFGLAITLFASKAPVGERLALAAFAVGGPGWVYVGWPGPEMFSWSFALVAVALYRGKQYAWSSLAAGIASLQNQPIIIFCAVPVLAALFERRWRAALLAAIGGAVGLYPYLFYYQHFGKMNLIATDNVRTGTITLVRTWSQIADLSQGLLPFVPLLLLAALIGVLRMVYTRDRRALLLLFGTVAIALGTQVSRNWNSSCDGLQRYLVWLIPFVAGIAVAGIGNRRVLWVLAVAAFFGHCKLTEYYRENGAIAGGYLDHSTPAKWALTHCPKLYWVEPEIFVERTRHDDDWPMTPAKHPIAFVRPDGTVSKMFIDAQSIDRVAEVYDVDPAYLEELRADAAQRPLIHPPHPYYFPKQPPFHPIPDRDPSVLVSVPYFVHPPHGAVKVRAAPQVPPK